jgi:nitrogen fixation NifU-like protein
VSGGSEPLDGGLSALYRDVIVDHGRQPRNFGALAAPTATADGVNPLCGDELHIEVQVSDGQVTDIAFTGQGCAISQASASLMTEALKGMPLPEARKLYERVHEMLTGAPGAADPEALGKLAVLSGVSEFPTRVKCASLAWQAVRAALDADETDDSGASDGAPRISTE